MNIIKLLDKNTIDKIAAGEVVDRPVSIVKELVENSIDAGSTAISIEIKDGGKTLIRITDNGSGIAREQIALAFLRHSTSKINDASDLSFIHTLGFRGEALSSIAAVSQTELCTKTKDSFTGIIYKINGGEEVSVTEAGLPDGTTIIVRNLFYNTPARLKFLKSDQTEAGYITDTVQRIALSRPDISFKYTVNGSVKLNTSGNGNMKDAIYAVFGRDITANLLDVDDGNDILRVSGFIGKPEIARGNRNFEYFFINGRYIKDRVIQKALEDAYTGYQMKGTFPFAIFNITIEPELVDVNVHPSKMEIRFFNNEAVFNSVYEVIRKRITKRESIPEVILHEQKKEKDASSAGLQNKNIPEPFERKAVDNRKVVSGGSLGILSNSSGYSSKTTNVSSTTVNLPKVSVVNDLPAYKTNTAGVNEEPVSKANTASVIKESVNKANTTNVIEESVNKADTANVFVEEVFTANKTVSGESSEVKSQSSSENEHAAFISREARKEHRIIGEIFNTYWMVEYDEKLFIIDQHAAHEKVLYERFIKNIKNDIHYSQQLFPGIIVTLSPQEEQTFKKYEKYFKDVGFEAEHFGGSEYSISAVPTDLYSVNNSVLFLELLDDLNDVSVKAGPDILTERVATAACKAAVKGGNRLSLAEADKLIDELLSLENPYNCPHGRPTIVSMTKYELEKKFKRII